jgi:cell division protein FtsN
MSRLRDIIRRDGETPAATESSALPEGTAIGDLPIAAGRERMAHPLAYETESADERGKLPWLESATDPFDDDLDADQPLIPRKWLILGGVAFLALLAGVAYTIYSRSGSAPDEGQMSYADGSAAADDPRIPLIEAPKTPIRTEPLDAQGMKIPDQDKTIYDVADGQVVEGPSQLAEGPEQVIERAIAPVPALVPQKPPVVADPVVTPVPPLDAPVLAPKPAPAKPVMAAAPKPAAPKPVVKATLEPSLPLPAKPVMAAVSGGVYLQLGSFASQDRASTAWGQISGKPGLTGQSSDVREAGGAFKLRAGPFGSTAEAQSACAKLKAAGQGCFIAK